LQMSGSGSVYTQPIADGAGRRLRCRKSTGVIDGQLDAGAQPVPALLKGCDAGIAGGDPAVALAMICTVAELEELERSLAQATA
jgi:hypothetical protein